MFSLNKTSSNRKKLDQFSFFDFSLQKNGGVCEVARRVPFRLSSCLEFRGRFFCILCSRRVQFLVGFSFLFCLLCLPLPISFSVKQLLFHMFYILPYTRLHKCDSRWHVEPRIKLLLNNQLWIVEKPGTWNKQIGSYLFYTLKGTSPWVSIPKRGRNRPNHKTERVKTNFRSRNCYLNT